MTPGEESIAFHYAMGQAITQWAFIEGDLYIIVYRCMGDKDPRGTVSHGFFSIDNFRSKLGFVDRAFQTAIFREKHEAEWIAVRDHVASLSKLRNAIAHGRSRIFPSSKPGRRYALVPSFSKDTRKKVSGLPPTDSLCVRDIDLAGRQFAKASDRLRNLFFRIGGEDATPLAKLAQQEPQLLSLAELRSRIYVVLQLPDGSSRA